LSSRTRIYTAHKAVTAQLKALQDLLGDSEKSSFLKAAHAYPTETFPWNEESMLGLLLRKRLEPDVVSWLENGRSRGAALSAPAETAGGAGDSAAGMSGDNWDELWNWAGPAANDIVREVYIGGGSDEGSEEGSDEGSEAGSDEVDVEEEAEEAKDDSPAVDQPPAPVVPPLPLQSIMSYATLAGRLP
jgi:mediator of RNA polymerase II transcription subunit 8